MEPVESSSSIQYCKRCILHTEIPSVTLKKDGTCNYCDIHDKWNFQYPIDGKGENFLNNVLDKVKADGKGKEYDCIMGVSGGCDSSFLLSYLVDNGLRPLPVHFDNNWNTEIAKNNLKKITKSLDLELFKIGVDQAEYDDICRSFLLASVPDADIPNDIALTTVLYMAAEKYNLKYIMNAHSFRTEGTTPLGWSYMDGGYIESVHRKFGSIPLDTFPNLSYDLFKRYILMGFQRIRPIWSLDYVKADSIRMLEERFGWKWYGGHHMENRYTIFVGNYLHPVKFGMDLRYVEFSALIRSGFMVRDKALEQIQKLPDFDQDIKDEVLLRLNLTEAEFEDILMAKKRSHNDYETYKPRFKEDKEFFRNAMKKGLVPETFYRKYVEGVS
jgi:N-acetyl sugar amidotransferase